MGRCGLRSVTDNKYMDVLGFSPMELAVGRVCSIADGNAAVLSRPAPHRESANEDAVAIIAINHHAAVLVVADGLGGLPAGEQASTLAVDKLIESLHSAPQDETSFRGAILNGIEAASQAIAELGVGAATTLVVAEIQGHTVRPYHVGDSALLIVGQRGRIKRQTVAHSPVGYALEAGLLDESEAMYHAERHVVSNVLGMADMRVEVGSTVQLAPHDTLLLASDGLLDNLHTEEIVERIRKGPLARVIDDLAEECSRRMAFPESDRPCKPDDLSFIAFRRGGASL